MQTTHLSAAAVKALLATLTVQVNKYRDRVPAPALDVLYLAVPHEVMSVALATLSKADPQVRTQFSTPLCYVTVTPELREILRTRGLYGDQPGFYGGFNTPKPLSYVYSLELTSHRQLFLKYTQIIGSKAVGSLSEEQYDELSAPIVAAVEKAIDAAVQAPGQRA